MNRTRFFLGAFIVILGVSLLVELPVFRLAVAFFIIYTGIRMITGEESVNESRYVTNENSVKRIMIFSGMKQKVVSEKFEGGEIVAIFGGGELDLSQVKTNKKELNLSLVAVFGGIKVRIPPDWVVKSEGVGILGAFENRSRMVDKERAEVSVDGVAIFGGVEISN